MTDAGTCAFVEAEYDSGHHGLEVRDTTRQPAEWRPVVVYQHSSTRNIVLWFGASEYEGIGSTYRWGVASGRPCLLDSDGDRIKTRLRTQKPDRDLGLPDIAPAAQDVGAGADTTAVPPVPAAVSNRPAALAMGAAKGVRQFLPFEEAKQVACRLRLSGWSDWGAWSRSGARPLNIPARPVLEPVAPARWASFPHIMHVVSLGFLLPYQAHIPLAWLVHAANRVPLRCICCC